LAAFRESVEWDAVHWVMGIEEDMFGGFMKDMKNIAPDKQMDDAALAWIFRGMLPVVRKAEGMEPMVQELVGWGMVTPVREEEKVYLTVHSLVREFCREKSGAEWQKHLTEAAGYYTNKYRLLVEEKKTLSTVLEEVEAAELLMEAENFEAAAEVIINNHSLLDRWGWGRLLESLYDQVQRALPGVELKTRAIILHNLAILMQKRGEYAAALEKYEQSLKIREEIGDKLGIAQSLHQVGMIYQRKGEYAAALEKYDQSLKIEEELGNCAGIAQSLHQVGRIYQDKDEYAAALEKYEQSLKIREEIGDKLGIAQSLHNIAAIYQDKGEYAAALEKYEQSLKISEEIGDKWGIAQALHNIAAIYQDKGEYASALEKYEQSLKILEELSDRAGVAGTLHNIGSIYHHQKKYPEAFENYQIAFSVFTELESPDAQIAEKNLARLREDWGEKEFEGEKKKIINDK
jgi:tetratricopeptide (TPR) repeat protein